MYLPSIHKEPLLQAPCSDLCIAIHLAVSRQYTCGTRFQTHPMPRRPFPCNQSPPCRFLPFHLLCSPARTPTPRPPLWFKGGAHSAWWPHLCRDGRCHRRLCATCDGHHALDTPSLANAQTNGIPAVYGTKPRHGGGKASDKVSACFLQERGDPRTSSAGTGWWRSPPRNPLRRGAWAVNGRLGTDSTFCGMIGKKRWAR